MEEQFFTLTNTRARSDSKRSDPDGHHGAPVRVLVECGAYADIDARHAESGFTAAGP